MRNPAVQAHCRSCRTANPAVHFDADGCLIRVLIDPNCPLFELKSQLSIAEMDGRIATLQYSAGCTTGSLGAGLSLTFPKKVMDKHFSHQ